MVSCKNIQSLSGHSFSHLLNDFFRRATTTFILYVHDVQCHHNLCNFRKMNKIHTDMLPHVRFG